MDALEEFGKHLDKCEQCRSQPFNLCMVGYELLLLSADAKPLGGAEALFDHDLNYPSHKISENAFGVCVCPRARNTVFINVYSRTC